VAAEDGVALPTPDGSMSRSPPTARGDAKAATLFHGTVPETHTPAKADDHVVAGSQGAWTFVPDSDGPIATDAP
jgi:hypothetical protein